MTETATNDGTGARPRRLTGGDVGIPPRHLDFRLPEQMARWAYADNATATLFLAMLSAIFPPGRTSSSAR